METDNEPHSQLSPRAKRLLIILMVTPWVCLAVYLGTPLLNSQRRHIRAVEAHIEKVAPQWDKFRGEHPGFERVKLFVYTGGDGMFGAFGSVSTQEQLAELRKFMENTSPPRPVYLESVSVDDMPYNELQKLKNDEKVGRQ